MNSSRDAEALAGPWRLAARASLSPTLLGLYTSIRALPVVGRAARKLAATLVPPGRDVSDVGSDTTLVAPVRVEDGAYIGAASCITKNVPAGALAVSRSRQMTVDG